MLRAVTVIFSVVLLLACSPKIKTWYATADDFVLLPKPPKAQAQTSPCYDPLSYVEHPELMRMKYLRVNFHFMNSADGRYNMPREEVAHYAREIVRIANDALADNNQMLLPHGNSTPVLPIPYRYVISPDPAVPGDEGVYYHIDDELCYAVKTGRERNISDKRVIQKYALRTDSVLNIFIQTHHLDSIGSPTYKPDASGISLGSSVKLFGRWFERPHPWGLRAITNHEIGHSLGLSHTWSGYDGCDDTPAHPNCYNVSEKPPCDTMFSNNLMDYNNRMNALTPCQIGKVLANMTRLGAMQRNMLESRWCRLDTSATVTIADSVRWNGSADLEGHIVIREGGHLEIGCRVSMPKDAVIKIYPGGKLTVLATGKIHNACGDLWGGIELTGAKRAPVGQVFIIEGGAIENTPSSPAARS